MGPGRPPRVHCAPGFEQMYMCMLHKLCWILFSISFQLARFQCWGSWVFFCPGRASARLHAPLWGFRCFKFVDFRHISMAEIGLLGAGLRLHSGSFSTQCISIYIVDRSIIEISDCVKFNQFGWVFRFVVLFWCRLDARCWMVMWIWFVMIVTCIHFRLEPGGCWLVIKRDSFWFGLIVFASSSGPPRGN